MTLDILKVSGTHFEVGHAVGARFRTQIARTVNANISLQETVIPYHQSANGQRRYAMSLALHRQRYSDYVAELEGMAAGSQQSFESLFLANMRGEYAQYSVADNGFGCSTCSVMTDEFAAFGHNEDGLALYQESTYLVEVSIHGKPTFTAFCYPGLLPGNAFGFNEAGICHSVNNVRPHSIRSGIGRHFLARSIFEAETIADAISAVTAENRASGFNYTIGSLNERKLVDVEVAPLDYITFDVGEQYFHANHFRRLEGADQTIMPSSWLRVERGDAVLATKKLRKPTDILKLLRDQNVADYPILRNGRGPDDLVTLSTGLFDLDKRTLQIYSGTEPFELLYEVPIFAQ